MPESPPLFRSSRQPGYLPAIAADPRARRATKRTIVLAIEFAAADGALQTREGRVQVRRGDAIVTGLGGERWRVSAEHFDARYRAVPPTVSGRAGRYESLPIGVLAIAMSGHFDVVLRDGVSQLHGEPGDWLVDYGDGSLGIVSPAIFDQTYTLED